MVWRILEIIMQDIWGFKQEYLNLINTCGLG